MTEKMTVADLLKQAIQAEIEGRSFYLMAAQSTPDEKGREVFTRLAQDEEEHAAYLRKQYDAYMASGKLDGALPMTWQDQAPIVGGIFSESLRARIQEAHFEMTALSVGAQLEQTAMEFYRTRGEQASDPVMKEVFLALAQWEQGHYKVLTEQLDALKGDFWAANAFAPF